jgi:hypothetical protein
MIQKQLHNNMSKSTTVLSHVNNMPEGGGIGQLIPVKPGEETQFLMHGMATTLLYVIAVFFGCCRCAHRSCHRPTSLHRLLHWRQAYWYWQILLWTYLASSAALETSSSV